MQNFALEFINRLGNSLSTEDLAIVLKELEIFCSNYDINKKETSVSTHIETLPEEYQMFMIAKKVAGRSESTLRLYNYHIVPFLYSIAKPVKNITDRDIIVYLYSLQKNHTNMGNRTLEHVRLILSSFFSWCHNNAYISTNPMNAIQPIKFEKKDINPIGEEDFERIRQSFTNIRDKAVFEVLYSTGCRIGELVNIKLQDIDLNSREVHLFGKGQKHRISFLNTRALIAVKDYIEHRPESEYKELFLNIRRPYSPVTIRGMQSMLYKHGYILEDRNLHPHLLRTQLSCNWVSKNLPVEELQQILRHEKLSTTQLYFKVSKEKSKIDHQRFIA